MNRTSRNTKIGLIMMFFVVAAMLSFAGEKCDVSYCNNYVEEGSIYCDRHDYMEKTFDDQEDEYISSYTPSKPSSESTSDSSSSSTSSSSSKKPSYSSSSKKSYYTSYNSYDDGYEDVYEDDDYDWDRYYSDDEYAAGVDDAMDELDW